VHDPYVAYAKEYPMAGTSTKMKTPKRPVEHKGAKNLPVIREAEDLVPTKAPGSLVVAAGAKRPISFSLNAPEATAVFVAGSFNGWDPASTTSLKRDKKGQWSRVVRLGKGKHEYRFVVDGAWFGDPTIRFKVKEVSPKVHKVAARDWKHLVN
jgi:1,4-alpha-glucan branching enzyme